MRILNFGSVNIDHVYAVREFVRPGETIGSQSYRRFSGGKGFNQSVALARAGARAFHAGKIGADGFWLKERLVEFGVNVAHLHVAERPTGHAIIQVDSTGQNAIILHGGANQAVGRADVEDAVAQFGQGEFLLLQNETSAVADIIELGAERGMKVVFNPAPMTESVLSYPLDRVDTFIVNEIEGAGLTGETAPERILGALRERFPRAAAVLTLGKDGVLYADSVRRLRAPAQKVDAVDTTAAGDTFIGFFLAEVIHSGDVERALRLGCHAAAVCVTRPGAADSIPLRSEAS